MNAAKKLLLAVLMTLATTTPSLAAETVLRAARVEVHDPTQLLAPDAKFWKSARLVEVAMLPQMVAKPSNPNPAIKSLKVRAVHNGHWLAFLLEWDDPTQNDRVGIDRFGDQVAVQMPVKYDRKAIPNPMMGNPGGGRVDIWQWRAAFQRDLDAGEHHALGIYPHAMQQLRELYPNAVVDLYPDEVLRATDARPYMGALGVDNPISHPKRTPVLDQMAEGFGTLTAEPEQDADGKGVWKDGKWRVVITHTMSSAEPEADITVHPGGESIVAFAVWDGGSREVGARKAWSAWVPLKLAK
mgnify:CR=1 FL=1